jgi:hypothetical protein
MPLRSLPVAGALIAGCASTPQGLAPDASTTSTASAPPIASGSPAETAPVKPPAAPGKTLFVDSREVECEGEGVTKCLRVRESEAGEWTLFYRTIEGFSFEPGYSYELRVEVSERANPPADASKLRHRLVEIVSKRKAP